MKNKAVLFFTGLLILSVVFVCGEEKGPASLSKTESLLRMDLLNLSRGMLKPPTRNIFASVARRQAAGLDDPDSVQPESDRKRYASGLIRGGDREKDLMSGLQLSYVGFVLVRTETIGLVIYGGQTLVVREGDWLDGRFQVGRISPEEILILGPDSRQKTFSLEGEQ